MNLLTPQILGLVGGVLALLAVNAIAAGILSAAISLSLLPYDWFSRLIGPAQPVSKRFRRSKWLKWIAPLLALGWGFVNPTLLVRGDAEPSVQLVVIAICASGGWLGIWMSWWLLDLWEDLRPHVRKALTRGVRNFLLGYCIIIVLFSAAFWLIESGITLAPQARYGGDLNSFVIVPDGRSTERSYWDFVFFSATTISTLGLSELKIGQEIVRLSGSRGSSASHLIVEWSGRTLAFETSGGFSALARCAGRSTHPDQYSGEVALDLTWSDETIWSGMLPGHANVVDQWTGQPQLPAGSGNQPGPAIGCIRMAGTDGSPAQRPV
jgi:hypothetical protein